MNLVGGPRYTLQVVSESLNPLHHGCRVQTRTSIFQTIKKSEILIFIAKFGFIIENALKWVQTSLALVQYFYFYWDCLLICRNFNFLTFVHTFYNQHLSHLKLHVQAKKKPIQSHTNDWLPSNRQVSCHAKYFQVPFCARHFFMRDVSFNSELNWYGAFGNLKVV